MEFFKDAVYVTLLHYTPVGYTVDILFFIWQDFRLLFHKCALLHSQNRIDEFLEAGIEMFRLFFIDVYYLKDLAGLCSDAVLHIH